MITSARPTMCVLKLQPVPTLPRRLHVACGPV